MKLLLLVILVASCTVYGFTLGTSLKKRVAEIRDWQYSLKMLETEIRHSHLPLIEIYEKIATQFTGIVARFYKNLAQELQGKVFKAGDAFVACLEKCKSNSYMKQPEYEILIRFGKELGQYDRVTEQKQIQLAYLHLEREEEQAVEEMKSKEKMYRSLGFLSGLLLAILLI